MTTPDIGRRLADHIDAHFARLRQAPLGPSVTPQDVQRHLADTYGGFTRPRPMGHVFDDVAELLWRWSEHAGNPRHFGLTRPTVDKASVVADALVSLYDPNLATWEFSGAASEIERYTLATIAARFGHGFAGGGTHFTSGGQEANHTAVAAALTRKWPCVGNLGLRGLGGAPVMYLSAEGHHSFDKIAHVTGIGRSAVRLIPVTDELKIDVAALTEQIARDVAGGYAPFMVVATAGTINAGVIDPLDALADAAAEHGLWYHVDAAWGGAAVMSDRLRPVLAGIDRADSITCDAHKLFSVPVGAGMFFCRDQPTIEKTFGTSAAYVPEHANDGRVYPYVSSMQWSRRFIGLKVFMMFAVRGVEEIAQRIEHQCAMGDYLRRRLRAEGWAVLNETPLPVVNFTHPAIAARKDRMTEIVSDLKARDVAWISQTLLGGSVPALRASITNFETQPDDIAALVDGLNDHL